MRGMAGERCLMQFAVFDLGAVASLCGSLVRRRLYSVGNPAIADLSSVIQAAELNA